jgi:hypothetical protein
MPLQRSDTPVQESTAWRPEKPGDSISGKLTKVSSRDGGHGEYPVLRIENSRGEWSVHAFHSVLRSELRDLAPKVNDSLTITYLGKIEKEDRGYHKYEVRGSDEVDWDRYAVEGDKFVDGNVTPDNDSIPF